MTPGVETALEDTAAAVSRALSALRLPHMLIGGLAVGLNGYRRATKDVDFTTDAASVSLEALFEGLSRHGLVPRIADAPGFARSHYVLLLRHEPMGTPVDISMAWLPFEQEAIARAARISIAGEQVPTIGVQDLIVYKAVAFRPQDRADIHELLLRHGDRVDLEAIRACLQEFAKAMEMPGRVQQFDAIVHEARGGLAERQVKPPRARS